MSNSAHRSHPSRRRRWAGSRRREADRVANRLVSSRTCPPPAAERDPTPGDAADRDTCCELFFDLVYVFAITQLSRDLLEHPAEFPQAESEVSGRVNTS